jgi:4-hydroxy-tetrahydrodipicolinate reductase
MPNASPNVKPPTPIIVFGASGRMGARLCALASASAEHRLIAAIVRDGSPRTGQPVREVSSGALMFANPGISRELRGFSNTVVIDFSSDVGARDSLAIALDLNAALLVGTTALSASTTDALRAASARIPLLITPNTSIGVAALCAVVKSLSRTLGAPYDCSIVEAHHHHKKDAPSGTALRLAAAARQGGATLNDDQILSIRGGDVVGEHTVRFAGQGEYIELAHRATSRDLFARGALHAAAWLSDKSPGSYSMEDVLGIRP